MGRTVATNYQTTYSFESAVLVAKPQIVPMISSAVDPPNWQKNDADTQQGNRTDGHCPVDGDPAVPIFAETIAVACDVETIDGQFLF